MIIGVGEPGELEPDLVYQAIAATMKASTTLRDVDELGAEATPSSLLHRSFRVDPGDVSGIGMKARPGDVILVTQRYVVVITHELDPNARRASFARVSADFRDALRALLTRTELSGLAQPLFRGSRVVRTGHRIDQFLSLDVQYHIALPDAAGPE